MAKHINPHLPVVWEGDEIKVVLRTRLHVDGVEPDEIQEITVPANGRFTVQWDEDIELED
jgi:hypothetical protein